MWLRTSVTPIAWNSADDLLRVEVQLLGHLVDANLAAHRASGPCCCIPAPSRRRRPRPRQPQRAASCSSPAMPAWRTAQIATVSLAEQRARARLFVFQAMARPSATARCDLGLSRDRCRRRPRRSPAARPARSSAPSAASAPTASAPGAPRREQQPRHPPVARRRRAGGRAPSASTLDLALERPREPPRRLREARRAEAWTCAPRPNAPAGEVERRPRRPATTRRTSAAASSRWPQPTHVRVAAARRALRSGRAGHRGRPRRGLLCFGLLARAQVGCGCAASRALARGLAARRLDRLRLARQEVLRALLDGARLLDAEARLDGELVLVLAQDVLDASCSRRPRAAAPCARRRRGRRAGARAR